MLKALSRVGIIIFVVLSFCVSSLADENNVIEAPVLAYINSQLGKCTLGDGYQCAPKAETDIIMDQSNMIPASYLQIWPMVYVDFSSMSELSAAQKNLQHYQIGFAENEQHYIVIFRALLIPEINLSGEVAGVSRVAFGKSIRYTVDNKTHQLISRKFYK